MIDGVATGFRFGANATATAGSAFGRGFFLGATFPFALLAFFAGTCFFGGVFALDFDIGFFLAAARDFIGFALAGARFVFFAFAFFEVFVFFAMSTRLLKDAESLARD